ncbi:MAG: hypothetical protein LPK92_06485, partial [Actinomycetes bacterium]|nr:hypothetical protein [Actinomycetes bacterium]
SVKILYKQPTTIRPLAGHIWSCNRLPGTRDNSGGFWRSLEVIPFDREVPQEQRIPGLGQLLVREEGAAIATWALRGAVEALSLSCYPVPRSCRASKEDWKETANPILAFLNNARATLERPADGWIKAATLYGAFRMWAVSEGLSSWDIPTSKKFGMELVSLKVAKKLKNDGAYYLLGPKPVEV